MTEAAQVNTSRGRRKWLFSGLVFVIGCITLWAGFWQLERADEKEALLAQLAPSGLVSSPAEVAAFAGDRATRIRIPVDAVLPERIFLENRIVDGRAGYEVFVRAQTGSETLLVNAGWIPAERTRDRLPVVELSDTAQLTGLWVPLTEGYVTGQSFPERLPDGVRVQSLRDVDLNDLRPGLVLAEGWLPVNASGPSPRVGVATHIGYAVQWFAMTFAIGVAWIWWLRSWRRRA